MGPNDVAGAVSAVAMAQSMRSLGRMEEVDGAKCWAEFVAQVECGDHAAPLAIHDAILSRCYRCRACAFAAKLSAAAAQRML